MADVLDVLQGTTEGARRLSWKRLKALPAHVRRPTISWRLA